jgi:hypothetical protein
VCFYASHRPFVLLHIPFVLLCVFSAPRITQRKNPDGPDLSSASLSIFRDGQTSLQELVVEVLRSTTWYYLQNETTVVEQPCDVAVWFDMLVKRYAMLVAISLIEQGG